MFLIFQLRRLDVWPVDDYGIRKGYSLAYSLRNLLTPKQLQVKGERFRPYRTVAAWYCWRAVHEQRKPRRGLPPTRIYDLRHFHATFLIASGIDPRTSDDRLGHSSASFMLKTYAHAVARAQDHVAAVANDLLTRSASFQG